MAKLTVLNKEGKESGSIDLPDEIFSSRVNTSVIHQAVVMYNAAKRQGNACTKERDKVSGGGIKPWRQKGTGRARHGSSRSPLWRGGGTTFGPQPRNFKFVVAKKIREKALRESLNAKFQTNNLTCFADIKEPLAKTQDFSKILNKMKVKGRTLAIVDGCDESVARASKNIRDLHVMRAGDVNAHDVLKYKKLLASKSAFETLIKKIK